MIFEFTYNTLKNVKKIHWHALTLHFQFPTTTVHSHPIIKCAWAHKLQKSRFPIVHDPDAPLLTTRRHHFKVPYPNAVKWANRLIRDIGTVDIEQIPNGSVTIKTRRP
jgi:hypothetical protein